MKRLVCAPPFSKYYGSHSFNTLWKMIKSSLKSGYFTFTHDIFGAMFAVYTERQVKSVL
jgi:hypothetical protein